MRAGSDAEVVRRTAFRLGVQTTAIVALIVVLLTGMAALVVLSGQRSTADRLLADTVSKADDVGDPPAGMWLTIRERATEESTTGMPAGLPDRAALDRVGRSGATELDEVQTAGGHYRVRTEAVRGEVIQAVLDLHADRMAEMRLVGVLLAVGVAGLGLAAAVGFWLGRRAVRPLAEALALQRRFVADAGHELRTPLTLLSTRAQLLHRRTGGADAAGLVRDTRHLNRIVEDLLIAADPRAAAAEAVDLVSIVDDVVAAARPAAEGIELHWSAPTLPAPVTGSATALRRAVTALLDNALQHAESTVDITVAATGRMVELSVGDDGPGIAPEVLPRVFDRFASFRQGSERRRGYGLGLALVAEIAQRHNGSVSAGAADTGGALLRLSLPRKGSADGDRRVVDDEGRLQ